MEIKKRLSGSSKGQMMSIATLIFGLIIIAALVVFVIININYDQISQSSVISSSSTNYGSILQKSADSFAYSSGSAALKTLYVYESNSSLRRSNFITNFSEFMQYLMVNGTLPNVVPDSVQADIISGQMNSSTLAFYNSTISSVTGTGSKIISVNESRPQILQTSPYYINITYVEFVRINTSTGIFSFSEPVSAAVPLNNTPDLFYAQQGVYRPMRFGALGSLATVIGNDYATAGNTTGLVYGIVQNIASPTGACPAITLPSTQLEAPQFKSQVIIVTPNAMAITTPTCHALAGYGGLIAENISSPPSVPWLQFSATNNALPDLYNGYRVLLYGPGLDAMDISGLVTSINRGDYFTSPFTSSYMQRSSGSLQSQSPYGIFTFSGYGRQAAFFNETNITTTESQTGVGNYTVAAWIYPESGNGIIVGAGDADAPSTLTLGIGAVKTCGAVTSSLFFGDIYQGGGVGIGVNTVGQLQLNRWYFVTGTFSSSGSGSVNPSQFRLYVNGVNATVGECNVGGGTIPLTSTHQTNIGGSITYDGYRENQGYNGLISNVQIYESALSPSDVYRLYQAGIESLPLSNRSLMGWYPLNGNPNDYSGNGYVVQSNFPIRYMTLPGYTRDSILIPNASQYSYPIPGIYNCNNNVQCANITTPHLYLNDMPLAFSNFGLSVAYFNGTSYFEQGGGFNFTQNSRTQAYSISIWVYPLSQNGVIVGELGHESAAASPQQSILELVDSDAYATTGSGCVNLGYVKGNSWNNIVLTYSDSGYAGAYINGQPAPSGGGSSPGILSGGVGVYYPLGIKISGATCGSSAGFVGMMANYQLYNTTLSSSQAGAIYSSGIDAAPVAAANVVGWWPLDGNGNDYSGNQNTGFGNSLSYRFIASNYSAYTSLSPSSIGLSTVSGLSGEWQYIGFPARSLPDVIWNVTAWTAVGSSGSPNPVAYPSNPMSPTAGANIIQLGSWFSGFVGGDQGWNFGTDSYRGTNYFGSAAGAFPQMVNILNKNVTCTYPYTTTGYTAATTMALNGKYSFRIASNDEMAVFYKSTGAWQDVFSGEAWDRSPASGEAPQVFGPVNVTFAPGTYTFAVDWLNGCGGGLSQFSMSPVV